MGRAQAAHARALGDMAEDWHIQVTRSQKDLARMAVQTFGLFGDVMVGTVEARWRVKYLGRSIDDCVLLTDVWVRDDDRWQAVRRHSSPMPPGECVGA